MPDPSTDPDWTHPTAKSSGMGLPALAVLAACGVVACVLTGAVTNAINVRVSPGYYRALLGWRGGDITALGVAQGIFEGAAIGLALALLFVGGVVGITRARCSFGFALRHLLAILAAALVAWGLVGLLAMGLASLFPEWYRMSFRGAPTGDAALLRFAWVGGSIVGIELGGFAAVIGGLVVMREDWRGRVHREGQIPA